MSTRVSIEMQQWMGARYKYPGIRRFFTAAVGLSVPTGIVITELKHRALTRRCILGHDGALWDASMRSFGFDPV